jgi:hypothetical protein
MAKLYRRIPRLPHHALIAVLVLAGAPATAQERRAQEADVHATDEVAPEGDPRLVRLESYAEQLGSADEAERRRAYEALTTLGPDMLPAIRARIQRLKRRRPEPRYAFDAWTRIRRAAGSTRADDEVDIAPGVLVALREERRESMLRVAEPLLLWRSLERIGTFEACRAMYPLFNLDADIWRWETRALGRRMGPRLMAAAIAGRNHPDRAVRGWSSATMERLHADNPGLAVQGLDHEVLADVLRAYAMLRMQSAMRVIVSYVDSESRSVRRAARWAMEQYGGNAIWILRTEYANLSGEQPPREWGFRRVSTELYARIDEQRMAPVRRALDEGIAARDRGDFALMRARFDDVLSRTPDVEEAQAMAEGYAALAAAATSSREATWAYRRALRLAPEHPSALRWRAALVYDDAERDRRRGFVDAQTYRSVLGLDAAHAGARARLEEVAEQPVATHRPPGWIWLAAMLSALLGGVLLLVGRRKARVITAAYESTIEAPTFEQAEATLDDYPPMAESTVPG